MLAVQYIRERGEGRNAEVGKSQQGPIARQGGGGVVAGPRGDRRAASSILMETSVCC